MAAPTKIISTSQAFQDAKGNVVANGFLMLQLSQNAEVTASGGQVTTQALWLPLDANGKITNTAIWFNDELSPSGTVYFAKLFGSNGMLQIQDFGGWAIIGASADLSTVVPTSPSVGVPGVVLLNPAATQTIVQPSGTNLAVNRFEQIRFADQFAGADMGAKINAAIADIPSTGGIVDATAFQGAQSAAATITINKPLQLLLGGVTLTCAGAPAISIASDSVGIIGLGMSSSSSPATGTIIQTSSGTADIIAGTGQFASIRDLTLRTTVARSAGAAINCTGLGLGLFSHIRIERTWNGIVLQGTSARGDNRFDFISLGTGASSAGNWNIGILIGNVASGTVASNTFNKVSIVGDVSPFAGGMIVIDSGCDTLAFSELIAVQGGQDSDCVIIQNTNTSNIPRWIRFNNSFFEAGNTKTGVRIDSALDVHFTNSYIATCLTGVSITGNPTGVYFTNSVITSVQQSAFVISTTSASDINVINCRIGDTSKAANNGFHAVSVAANANDFKFIGNDFARLFATANLPISNININAGTSDRYLIACNHFIDSVGTALLDAGTGANKQVHSNVSTSAPLNLFSGNFQLQGSNVGINVATTPGTGILATPSLTTNATQIGMQMAPSTSSSATIEGSGVWARADTPNVAFTQALNTGVHVNTPTKGAASTITEWNGLRVEAGPTAGSSFAVKAVGTEAWFAGGKYTTYNNLAAAGEGLVSIRAVTSQKSESAADTNVLTLTPPAVAGTYRLNFVLSLSAANTATLGWTATWKDSNGAAQAPTNMALSQTGVAAPALTFTTSAAGNYYGTARIDIDASATNIVIKLTFTGTSFTGKASAAIERIQ